MSDSSFAERTEAPTPLGREKARSQGRVPRSSGLTLPLALLGGFGALAFLGAELLEGVSGLTRRSLAALSADARALSLDSVPSLTLHGIIALGAAVLPFALVSAAAGAASGALQGGAAVRWGAVAPDIARLNPFEGARKLLLPRSLARGLFVLLKAAVVAWLLAQAIEKIASNGFPAHGVGGLWHLSGAWTEVLGLGFRLSFGLAAVGALELAFTRFLHERDLRMTPREAREERRDTEGNPEWKRRRRKASADRARGRADPRNGGA